MLVKRSLKRVGKSFVVCLALFMACLVWMPSMVQAFTVNVVDQDGNPVNGFRWLVEEDTTNVVTPGTFSARTLGVNIHGTYAPVATKGRSSTSSANINVSSDQTMACFRSSRRRHHWRPPLYHERQACRGRSWGCNGGGQQERGCQDRPDFSLCFPGYCPYQ